MSQGVGKLLHYINRNTGRARGKARLFIEGERPEKSFVAVPGWAYRYKSLFDGPRLGWHLKNVG